MRNSCGGKAEKLRNGECAATRAAVALLASSNTAHPQPQHSRPPQGGFSPPSQWSSHTTTARDGAGTAPIGIGGYKARAWSAVASPAVFEVRTTADSRGGGGPGRALRAQAQETHALAHFDFATHPNQSESPFRVD